VATDWATIASLATAGGTLVLAVSTFASVRSANRAARVAEQALLVGLRPLLVPSRLQDDAQKISFIDGTYVPLPGGCAAVKIDGDIIYLAISLRNAGRGIAVLHSWHVWPGRRRGEERPDLSVFRRLSRDLFVSPSDVGFWQGAFRDPADPARDEVLAAIKDGEPLTIDLLYGDYEGGQRVISRFLLQHRGTDSRWLASVARHWNVDRPDPR
jgi:hypothetical protein